LKEQGFEILLIGRKSEDDLKLLTPFKTKQYRMLFKKGFLFYAEFNFRLFWTLLFEKKSLVYANDLDTLLPSFLVSRFKSNPMVYDSHEYFTEVPELVNRPFVKYFWEKLETYIFPKLENVITVNEKLAEIYSEKYKVPVTAIRNVPELFQDDAFEKNEAIVGKPNNEFKEVLIYQGALNLGRGIELMIDCMEFLPEIQLLIAGTGDISNELKIRVKNRNLGDRIQFKGRLTPEKLKKMTGTASLGMSLEEDLGLSYRYALPNKIFDYIHAGIPVIVSDLPLMSHLVLENGVGEVLKDRSPRRLAELIRLVLSNKESYATNLYKAARKFNWNQEKKIFQKFIDPISNLE
jgi:glycosyltransferase involved in cell wall biosynthesis